MYVRSIKFENGKTWAIGYRIVGDSSVIIPIEQLDGLSDSDILACIRIAAREALLAPQESEAEWIVGNLTDYPYFSKETLYSYLYELEPWREKSRVIAETMDAIKAYLANYPIRKKEPRKTREGFVYLVRGPEGKYKIGRAVNVEDRIKAFGIKLPFDIHLEHVISSDDYRMAEEVLHERFAHRRTDGEWFNLTDEDIAEIKAIERI